MDAQPRGSLDPWCKDGRECKPEWDAEKTGHQHPLEFMAELLQQWPTGAPTVDLEDEERHLRFIQIVAGYPEIGRGMYPLDWPTHPMSVKALQLSLFLDSLAVPEELIQNPSIKAHSVRSAILALDARKYEYGKKGELDENQLRSLHRECLTLLFKVIRVHVNRESNIDEIDDENREKSASHYEHLFLNNLHSSQKKRREGWWFDSNSEKKFKLDLAKSDEQVNREQHTHQIKLGSIQNWIQEWSTENSKNYPFEENTRHNLLIGASVMLECLFAKLRQHIITEYRPGCILIDGGGRIEFLTKNSDVESEMKRVIEDSFLISENRHPFQDIIVRTLREYGRGRINEPQFPSEEWNTDTNPPKPRKAAFKRFIGEKRAIEFFPPIKYNGVDLYQEMGKNQFGCSLCSREDDSQESISKSVKSVQFKIQDVCFLHALMFRIGEAQQRRDSSIRRKGKSIPEAVGNHSCVFLDLNALGSMFGTPVSKTRKIMEKILHFHHPSKVGVSTEHWQEIESIRENTIEMQKKVRQMLEENNSISQSILDEEDEKFKLYMRETQEQLSIFKARKSFRFNSKWWSSISQIVDTDSKHFGEIGAWVAAGDDLLLVRRGVIGEDDETLQQQLKELDNLLKIEFPNSAIKFSFCAGLTKRRSSNVEGQNWEKIPDMIQRARKKEKQAKNYWKTRADKSDRDDLISEYDSISGSIKRKKGWTLMSEWVPGNGPVYSIPSVREGVPTEEESMIYSSTFRGEEE